MKYTRIKKQQTFILAQSMQWATVNGASEPALMDQQEDLTCLYLFTPNTKKVYQPDCYLCLSVCLFLLSLIVQTTVLKKLLFKQNLLEV